MILIIAFLIAIFITIIIVMLLNEIYIMSLNKYTNDPSIARTEKKHQPKTQFYEQTDKIWNRESLRYGSFDKIPHKKRNEIYLKMQEIANEVGYDGFKSEDYIIIRNEPKNNNRH